MNNVKRSAWFCPSCKSTHAPHCDTCPNQADAIATKVMPRVFPNLSDKTRSDCIAMFDNRKNFAGFHCPTMNFAA